MFRFTTRQSAVDELRRLVVDGIYRDHFLAPLFEIVKHFAQSKAETLPAADDQEEKKACPLHLSDALGTLLPVNRALCA